MNELARMLMKIKPGPVNDTFDEEMVRQIIREQMKSHHVTEREMHNMVELIRIVWSNCKNSKAWDEMK